ncbi:hypothetical protein Q3G72_012573 [Acer saccharum]|nr:hypothetical protein Q3G72_012573 [Acer saccharum]
MGVLILAFDGNLPTFPNLIRLEAAIDAYFGWKLLPHFLNNSPNLEALRLKKEYGAGKNSNVCEHIMTHAFQDSMKITKENFSSFLVLVAAFCFLYVFQVVSNSSETVFNEEVKG